MRLALFLFIVVLLGSVKCAARDFVKIRLMRMLADDPFVPYGNVVRFMGPDVDPEILAEAHSELMRIAAVPEGTLETVPRDTVFGLHSYIKRGPFNTPRPDLLKNYFITEADIVGSGHGLVMLAGSSIGEPKRDPLSFPNGWDDPTKAGIFMLMTPEIFTLHALSFNMFASASVIQNLAQSATFDLVTVEDIEEVRERELAKTVMPAATVRFLEDLYHRGIRSTSSSEFYAALPSELRGIENFSYVSAWMRLMIAPALRSGLRSITAPHQSYVFMPEATAMQFLRYQLRTILGDFNSLEFISAEDRRSAFDSVLRFMVTTVPQPPDAAIVDHMDSLGYALSATDITLIIERFEEITVIPSAVIARMRRYKPDAEMAGLFPEGSRLRNPRILNSIIPIWINECLLRGRCVNRGQIWELTPEAAQRAYMAVLPRREVQATTSSAAVDSAGGSELGKPLKRAKKD